jgi:hypothetical protein
MVVKSVSLNINLKIYIIMKTITITVKVNDNNHTNSSREMSSTFDNTPFGIAQAMLLLGDAIENANQDDLSDIVVEC